MALNLDFVVINFRGTAGIRLKVSSSFSSDWYFSWTPKLLDSGNTEDIDEVIDYLFEEHCLDDKGR